MSYAFEPFRPINTSLYLCDNKFHTEALQELLQDGTLEKDGRVYRIANTHQLLQLASLTG